MEEDPEEVARGLALITDMAEFYVAHKRPPRTIFLFSTKLAR
jgi:hypothetical protein